MRALWRPGEYDQVRARVVRKRLWREVSVVVVRVEEDGIFVDCVGGELGAWVLWTEIRCGCSCVDAVVDL